MTAVSTNSMIDIVRFLLARLDDDADELKREARRRANGHAVPADDKGVRSFTRLRADNESKREVIASAQHLLVLRDQPSEKPVRDGAATILRALAQAYEDHPAFRAEWR